MKTIKQTARWIAAKAALLLAIAAAAVIGGVSTAVVMAAIPDSSGVMHGCYRSSGLFNNGQLRVIDSDDQNCNANETALNWNQSGGGNGSNIYSNRLQIPLGSTGGQTLISISNLGEFTLQECLEGDPNGLNGQLLYRNTTSTAFDVAESAAYNTIFTTVGPNETYLMNGERTTFVTGFGEESLFTNFWLATTNSLVSDWCSFAAQAVVSSN